MNEASELLEKLRARRTLDIGEYEALLNGYSRELAEKAAHAAREKRDAVFGRQVYVRGLIEISSVCRNDCLYCGIRRSNHKCERYTLTDDEIIDCCDKGYSYGYRTFVLQSGEGALATARVCGIVSRIKQKYPDYAVTLSLGELPFEDYKRLKEAGADRYLLRHETADREHYRLLHPPEMSFDYRMTCLRELKRLGFQTGCGFMVGSPGQSAKTLAKDLKFVEEFRPAMCGIGPFIPHKDTPFAKEPAGTLEQTLFLLSLLRLISPGILLPATTALGTIAPNGRELGLEAGANVVMPNLSPTGVRKKYSLYDNKICTGEEAAECVGCLEKRVASVGMRIVTDRGDTKVK